MFIARSKRRWRRRTGGVKFRQHQGCRCNCETEWLRGRNCVWPVSTCDGQPQEAALRPRPRGRFELDLHVVHLTGNERLCPIHAVPTRQIEGAASDQRRRTVRPNIFEPHCDRRHRGRRRNGQSNICVARNLQTLRIDVPDKRRGVVVALISGLTPWQMARTRNPRSRSDVRNHAIRTRRVQWELDPT